MITILQSLISVLIGTDVRLRRMIIYWAFTAVLYVLCVFLLWFEVWLGVVPVRHAQWLSLCILGGLVLFYGLTRCSVRLGLTPSQLAGGQGFYAIGCTIAAYAIAAPVRGAVLLLLLVVLMFCAFALTPRKSHTLSAFAIVMLGLTMLWMTAYDPQRYSPMDEAVHFILSSSTLVAVAFLTGQFNFLRRRLKTQKTELAAALSRIQLLATRDELTLLPNRLHMKEVLALEEKRQGNERESRCLALLDIDFFKQINDAYGHAAGDEVLRSFAQQVQARLRASDVLARWGGEEFLLLLPNTEQETAMQVLERMQADIAELQVKSMDTALRITFSAGLTVLAPGEAVSEAIKRADKAMFQAKAAGRNTLRLFDPGMEAAMTAYNVLKMELRQSIQDNQFILYYQPQVNRDGTVIGAEALVRWQHAQRGLIMPADFIPVAEQTGLIVPLGQWVLHAACRQLAAWALHKETAHLSLSVNISAKQLRHPGFVKEAFALFEATRVDPRKLKMELTESMLVEEMEDTIAKMHTLKSAGVSFSLDDFGTGYSSLSYLKRLPLDQLKIDQSFVRDMLIDSNDAIIARTVVTLARSLCFTVIAEGVETTAQRDILAVQGCNDFQGFLYSRPLPLDQFEAFVSAQRARMACQ
jgi:diguanylate cyclase (GGDEF)-like protein